MPARLDQHFLVSESAADTIVSAAAVRRGDAVVEIGPGRGVLTGRLLDAGVRLTAVELDERLADGLESRFQGRDLRLIRADFLQLDLAELPRPAAIVSNLPYSVGTPILQRLLDWPGWPSAVLMFQKEVADRVTAAPGDRKYGVLSVSVRLKADAEHLLDVPRGAFSPPPKVESAVLRLTRLEKPRLPEGLDEAAFFRVVKAAFAQRRKMAAKSVAAALGAPRPAVEEAFRACGLAPTARAEELGLEDFARLALRLHAA